METKYDKIEMAKDILAKYTEKDSVILIDMDGHLVNKEDTESMYRIETLDEIIDSKDIIKEYIFSSKEEAKKWVEDHREELSEKEPFASFYRDYDEDNESCIVDAKEAWDYLFE